MAAPAGGVGGVGGGAAGRAGGRAGLTPGGREVGRRRPVREPPPAGVELVLTGRDAPDWLLERADYITEMGKRRHPYDRGIAAREGIEY